MICDSSWDVDQYKEDHEVERHWQFRRAFLIAHKNKFPENRLLCLAQSFVNIEFLGCKYPQETMDLIKSLSKDFVVDLRGKHKSKLQKPLVSASDAAKMYATVKHQLAIPITNNNEPPAKKMKFSSPFQPGFVVPGLILLHRDDEDNSENYLEFILRSTKFCGLPSPKIKLYRIESICHSYLYIKKKLIATGCGPTMKKARKDVSKTAYNKLKDICFTIKIKDADVKWKINREDIMNAEDTLIDESDESSNDVSEVLPEVLPELKNVANVKNKRDGTFQKLSDDNVGNKLLKMMGWKEGYGLGKHGQGRLEPIQAVKLPKHQGLGVQIQKTEHANLKKQIRKTKSRPPHKKRRPKKIREPKSMPALEKSLKKHLAEFIKSPKKKLAFSKEFTKDEREVIHNLCGKFQLNTKSRGKDNDRFVVVTKQQSAKEIFKELAECGFENDYYQLVPPKDID